MAIRSANAEWTGTLKDGSGHMKFSNYNGPYSFRSRFEEGDGTNPEELVGAAHAGCYSMFLSALITGDGLNPEIIETKALVNLGSDDTGPLITGIELNCMVKCEGLTIEKLKELAATAKEKCPISRLVSPTSVKLDARLIWVLESVIAGAITGMAIFIGAMGLFGMSMYVLKRIRREFAIRKANGAQVDHIVRLLARNYLILVISTLIMASPLEVLLLNRWLQNFVFRTTISWWIFFLTCGIALVILPVPQGIIYSGQLPKIHLKTSDTNNVLTSR